MKTFGNRLMRPGALFLIIPIWLLLAESAGAAEAAGDWRPMYDLILRYVNFIILAFLIIKYARKPLVNFFKEKSQDVKKEIEKIEAEKEEIRLQVKALQESHAQGKERLEQIKERIISQGRVRRQGIVDDAKLESKLLLENAQRKIDNQLIKAGHTLRMEMIDLAFDSALDRLPKEVTDQDSRRFIEHYLEYTHQ
jgi:F-type H+-transporting ATPase subunit b